MSDQFPPPPARRRRWPALVGAAVVVLAVAAGVSVTVTRVDAADRTVATEVWGKPKPHEQRSADSSADDLAGRLLPVPDGYTLGPDIDEFGNDGVMSGQAAAARLKKGVAGLPARQREAQDKAVDKLRLKGLAVRSYSARTPTGSHYYDDKFGLVVDVQLAQVQNRQAGRDLKAFRTQFIRSLGVFSKGPKIKGHSNADCFLAPRDRSTRLDMLVCSAYEDDLLVSATAYGPKSIDGKAVAALLARQLDHISSRGELV